MAKAEAPLAIRKMLGGHSSSTDETALLYSRDAMAEPMAHLERVMSYIRSGIFCPDSTRSGGCYLNRAQDDWDSEGHETIARQSASEQPSAVEPQVGAWCPDSDTLRPGDIEHQSAGDPLGGVAKEPPADGAGAGNCASCGSHNWPSWSCELCTATGCVLCLNLVPYLSSMMCLDCHDKQREADERPVASLAGLEQELPEPSSRIKILTNTQKTSWGQEMLQPRLWQAGPSL